MPPTDAPATPPRATGRCLCGAVRFAVHGPLRPVVCCHCSQCRRSSGHFAANTATRLEHLRLVSDAGLRWYQPDAQARRGFCAECGSSLFWEPLQGPRAGRQISIAAGALDAPTGLATAAHICIEDRSDYYTVAAGEPVYEGTGHTVEIPAA